MAVKGSNRLFFVSLSAALVAVTFSLLSISLFALFKQSQFLSSDSSSSLSSNLHENIFSRIPGDGVGAKKGKCVDSNKTKLDLLKPFGVDPKTHHETDDYVLVLGANGLIGRVLSERLEAKGYKVLKVLSRHHRDLRIDGALDIFSCLRIKFVYFLAYEVGGAKFLQLPQHQDMILQSNKQMMHFVFKWILEHKIRFAFASSSLSADNSTYGQAKRIGENITLSNPNYGRLFRLWNVYGFEYPGARSHVVPDFISQCIINKSVEGLTNGKELRQFLHVIDVSDAIIALMEHFEESEQISDISDGQWISLIEVGKAIKEVIPECHIHFSNKEAKKQKRHEPNLKTQWHLTQWSAKITLLEGVKEIYNKMIKYYQEAHQQTSLTIVINGEDSEKIQKKIEQMSQSILLNVEYLPSQTHNILDKAKGKSILFMDSTVMLTFEHLTFFQHDLPQDGMMYYANISQISEFNQSFGETIPSLAYFQTYSHCSSSIIYPYSKSFVAATKRTWLSINNFGNDHYSLHELILQSIHNYHSIMFQNPIWSWGSVKPLKPHS